MPTKKSSMYKHSNYTVFTKNRSFITSAMALVLVVVGVGAALVLSEMSQDTRSNATMRESARFKSGMLTRPNPKPVTVVKTDAESKAKYAEEKIAEAESARIAAAEAKSAAQLSAEAKVDAESKAKIAAMKDAEAENARIAAAKAKSAAQQTGASTNGSYPPPAQENVREAAAANRARVTNIGGTSTNTQGAAEKSGTDSQGSSQPYTIGQTITKIAAQVYYDVKNAFTGTTNGSIVGSSDNQNVSSGNGGGSAQGGGSGSQAQAQVVFPNATAPLELVLLNQTKMVNGKFKSRLVSKISQADPTLSGTVVVGEIYNSRGSNRKVLHECYIAIWDDYMVASQDTTDKPANWCVNSPSEVYKGVIGQLSSRQTETNNKPLKECFDETNLNHFYVTTEDGCKTYAAGMTPTPTVKESWTYGYIH